MNAIELSLQVDASDGVERGYPEIISLAESETTMNWDPSESVVEARTLRSSSDVDGPPIHGRVRDLTTELISAIFPDTSRAQNISRLLNNINDGTARGWLRAQKIGEADVWRSPIRSGSMSLSGASFQYELNKSEYDINITREPWWEDAAAMPTDLGTHNASSRTLLAYTAPVRGTVAAPIEFSISGNTITSGFNLHLFQDRTVPTAWTRQYLYNAGASSINTDGHNQIVFTTGANGPWSKGLDRPVMYQPVLVPSTSGNHGVVRSNRNQDAFSIGYGRTSAVEAGETELGILGRLGAVDSIFTGIGPVILSTGDDYFVLTSYNNRITGTAWRMALVPTDGYQFARQSFPGVVKGDPLYVSPGETCVVLPLVESLSGGGAEYTGSGLSMSATIRPRITEII